ncbi:MAG: peptidyl-prolyl cis-trans isomerase [Pseudomonadota bacterium]
MGAAPEQAWRRLLRDPLTHFLIAGAVLAVVMQTAAPRQLEAETIHVSRQALLEHFQYKTRMFGTDAAETAFDALPSDERRRLAEEYVREEALYREALRLGLNRSDYVIKRRMAQSLEHVLSASAPEGEGADEAQLRAAFEADRARYVRKAKVSFEHVFFAGAGGRQRAAAQLSADLGETDGLRSGGEAFAYAMTYAARTEAEIAAHFGGAFASSVLALEPTDTWAGPIASAHGWHLVRLARKSPARGLSFEEARSEIAAELASAKAAARRAAASAEVVEQFKVRYADDLF